MDNDQIIKFVDDKNEADYLYGGENYIITVNEFIELLSGKILNFDVNMEYGCTLELSKELRDVLNSLVAIKFK